MSLHFPGTAVGTFSGTTLPTGTAARTTALWFRMTAAPSTHEVLLNYGGNANGQRWDMFYVHPNALGLEATNFGAFFSWTQDSDWHHFAIVYPTGAGGNVQDALLYLDGVSQTITSGTNGAIATTNGSPQFGALNVGNVLPFTGDIADAAIWDIDLTADEIRAMAEGRLARNIRRTHLLAYWPMNGTYPNTAPDMNGTGLTITLTNTTQADHAPIEPVTRQVPSVGEIILTPQIATVGTATVTVVGVDPLLLAPFVPETATVGVVAVSPALTLAAVSATPGTAEVTVVVSDPATLVFLRATPGTAEVTVVASDVSASAIAVSLGVGTAVVSVSAADPAVIQDFAVDTACPYIPRRPDRADTQHTRPDGGDTLRRRPDSGDQLRTRPDQCR